MISPQQFRVDFPEFSGTAQYSNSSVTFWLNLAYSMLDAARWGAQLDIGAELYVAHQLAIEAKAQAEAASGAIPGTNTGPINSKAVDKVSAGFDTGASSEERGGHWNLTVYGTRFFRLARMFGAGPIQLGIGETPVLSGPAWNGPLTTPGFSNF